MKIKRLLRDVSIKTKFFVSFAALLVLLCAVGGFSLIELERMAEINRTLNSDVIPGIAVPGRMHDALNAIRVADAEFLHSTGPKISLESEEIIAAAKQQLADDLKLLAPSAGSEEEHRIVKSLNKDAPRFFRDNDEFVKALRQHQTKYASMLFMGDLDVVDDNMAALIDRYIEINTRQAAEAYESAAATASDSTQVIWLCILATLVAGLTIFAILVRQVVRPLLSMTRAMTSLADGALATAVPEGGRGDEIGKLADAMANFKASALTLQSAKELAEAGMKAKTQFLATMSHELRTPLNAIIGFSEIMKEQMFEPLSGRYRDYAGSIFDSGSHLLSLINDILDVTELDEGRLELNEEPIDLAKILSACVKTIELQAIGAKVTLHIEAVPSLPQLHADERRLRQILLNLLSNAVKFTPEGGRVHVVLDKQDGGIVFTVRDTGVGIAAKDIPTAFARFGQIDSRLSRKYEGSGLGLPLTKNLVELHGGTLELMSNVGVGTTVTVRFGAERIVEEVPVKLRA